MADDSSLPVGEDSSPTKQTDRLLASCGYLLVLFSVLCFGSIGFLKIYQAMYQTTPKYDTWIGFLQQESPTLILLLVAYITLTKGRSLLTTVRFTDTRTIPIDDLPQSKRL